MSEIDLPYGRQWIDEEDIAAVVEVLRGDWMTQGPTVAAFEAALCAQGGTTYAVAVSSGTAALHAACLAMEIGAGDEVIVPTLTFSATAAAVAYCGGTPVLCDIDATTLCVDVLDVARRITSRTKAIIAVDFAGHPAHYDALCRVADAHDLWLVSDGCHALGARYRGQPVGAYADMTVLSFHPVKHIATGEGGAVLTSDAVLAERLRTVRHHGIVKRPEHGAWAYDIEQLGYNYRLTDLQCALGLSQLKKLDQFVARRRALAARYDAALAGWGALRHPMEAHDAQSSYHLYVVQIESDRRSRRDVFDALRAQGIGVQVHYAPLHLLTYYATAYGYKRGDFPRAEAYYERALTLPLFPRMRDADVDRVVASLHSILDSVYA